MQKDPYASPILGHFLTFTPQLPGESTSIHTQFYVIMIYKPLFRI